MAEKKFPPSPRRLREARQKGDLWRARELIRAGSWLGVLAGFFLWGGWDALSRLGRRAFSGVGIGPAEGAALFGGVLVVLALGALGAFLFGSLAGGFLFSPSALFRPGGLWDLRRLGARRGEYWIGSLLIWGVLTLALWGGFSLFEELVYAPRAEVEPLFSGSLGAFLFLGVGLGGLGLLFGLAQALGARFFYLRRHRRSIEELLRDIKEEEGDRAAKERLRELLRAKEKESGKGGWSTSQGG